MKKYLFIAVAALLAFAACKNEEVPTGEGPEMTVVCDESALMGDLFKFKVTLQDNVPLSTLKAELLFDQTVVSEITKRTTTNGTYEDGLEIPFYKDIPDGVATVRFTAQNTNFAKTIQNKDVSVSRPDFEYLSLKTATGLTYDMTRESRNVYSIEGSFGASFEAKIVTPMFGESKRKIEFGYGATGVEVGAEGYLPFASTQTDYKITFNTLTFEASPFTTITVNGTAATMVNKTTFAAVVDLTKGQTVTIEGLSDIADWTADPDFLEKQSAGSYKFLPLDGKYKINISLSDKYFLVERMANDTDYATLNADGSGAVWMIGGPCYGKPAIFSASWKTDKGLCLAEVEPQIHQITFVAGDQLATSSIDVKLFHQKDWGGEFGSSAVISTDSELITVGESDGNIHLAPGVLLDMGGLYRFTLDLTGGNDHAVLHFAKVGQNEIVSDKISFAGTEMTMTSATTYQAVLNLAQGQNLEVSGIADISDWTIDPDFFEVVSAGSYKFLPISGYYKIVANTETKFFLVESCLENGAPATLADDGSGAVWMIGGACYGKPEIFEGSWNTDLGLCLSQITPKVHQITLIAGKQISADKVGVKFFHQKGWGEEFGENAYATVDDGGLIAVDADKGDISLKGGVTLEYGAPYRFTIDLTEGVAAAKLKFEKAGESQASGAKVAVNGTELAQTSEGVYGGYVTLEKGVALSLTGVDGLQSYWINPDLVVGGAFNAVSGKYKVTVDTVRKYITGARVTDEGGVPTMEQGGLYFVGYGIAAVSLDSQPGWEASNGAQLVEVNDKVFQLTGVAGEDKDSTPGVRIRYDYWGLKYLQQPDWGNETSKGLEFKGNAAGCLTQVDAGDIGLSSNLEKGATYRITIDYSAGASEVFTIDKL